MGKQTTAKVEDFRKEYVICLGYLKDFEKMNKGYVSQIAKIKKASKQIPDDTPVPAKLDAAMDDLNDVLAKYIPAFMSKLDAQLARTEKSLTTLHKWVEDKSKKDPTTWRKIKDTLCGK